MFDFQGVEFPKIFPKEKFGFSGILWSNLVGPKLTTSGFGSHGHVQKPENHANHFSGFPKAKSKVIGAK